MSSDLERLPSVMNGKTLSIAESCTGGMVSSMITGIPGASEFFLGSVVAYSNVSKERILGVNHNTLISFGAVSEQTAVEMAAGVKGLFNSDIAASITGIAGPSGGSASKPVGTVFMAVINSETTKTSEHRFFGSREEIQKASSNALISLILDIVSTS